MEDRLKKDISPVLCSQFQASLKQLLDAYLNGFMWVAGVRSKRLDWSIDGETIYEEGFVKTSHKGQFPGDEEELQV